MEDLIAIITFIFAVLQIVFLIKIWNMANNVEEIKNILSFNLAKEFHKTPTIHQGTQSTVLEEETPKNYDGRLDSLQQGDKVRIPSIGKVYTVMSVDKDRVFCQTSILGGCQYFAKNDVEFIG